jgi:hypothetical protein
MFQLKRNAMQFMRARVTASQPSHFDGRPDRRSLYSRAQRAASRKLSELECSGPPQDGFAVANLTPLSACDVFLMQTMSDQAACAFEKLQVFIVEGIQFIALRIEHPKNVPVVVAHRHDNLGTSGMKRRQISEILAHVAYDNGLARLQGRTAQSLASWKTWIRRRFLAAFGHNHELVLYDLVNAHPAIIARGANHLHELLHSLSRAPSGQGKRPNFLEFFARGFLHSRENNLAHKKPSASTISTFCGRMRLLNNDVSNT